MSCAFASLAIVVPTKNRPHDLDITIEGVLSQTVLPKQLIIVDQSASDESHRCVVATYEALPAEVRTSLELVYIRDTHISGASAARNRAMDVINADLVLFLDDDVNLEPDFNECILAAYREHPEAVGVSGIVTNYSPPPLTFRYWARIFMQGPLRDDRQPVYWKANRLRESPPVKVTRLGGGLMSFPVAAIGTIRFDENLHGACDGEDVDFTVRLWPGALFIAPRARLVHKHSPAGRGAEHWLTRHARTNWYLYRRNWNRGVRNRVCFLWLNVGYAIVAVLVSIRRRSLDSYTGLLKSITDSRRLLRTGA